MGITKDLKTRIKIDNFGGSAYMANKNESRLSKFLIQAIAYSLDGRNTPFFKNMV